MRYAQKEWLAAKLKELGNEQFIHGGCAGADEQAHHINKSPITFIYPASYPQGQSMNLTLWQNYHEIIIAPAKKALDRNHDIVDDSDILIACPGEKEEVLRSGTWATIRYAKKQGKSVIIIYPDGEVENV